MPHYTIIAGPNGSGKSTFSKKISLSGALIFDADKVKASKESQYPDLPADSIGMMVTSEYWAVEDLAIEKNKSLTVETNLRDDFLIDRLSYFKSRKYTLNLIFMLLPNIKTSMERVDLRINQKGHFVDADSISYNFEYSLKTLKQHYQKFDSVLLLNSAFNYKLTIPETLLSLKNNKVHYINTDIPIWAKPIIDDLIQNLNIN